MKYLVLLILLLFSFSLKAQTLGRDALTDLYEDVMHPTDELLNGREYTYYFHPLLSSPFIPADAYPTASVVFRRKMYMDVILQYDTFKDVLIYYNLNNRINNVITPVIVNRHIIDEFTLQLPSGRARFRYLTFPEDRDGLLRSGFYEIVSEGSCQIIIHHGSVSKVEEGAIVYKHKMERYIINAGVAYRIRGKKSLLEAISDPNMEVKEYLKSSKIRVRRANKEQIKRIIDYYNANVFIKENE